MKKYLSVFVGTSSAGIRPDVLLTMGVGGILAMLIIPLPAPLLDVLLATNMAVAALILVAVLVSARPLAVSSFPTLLLITTLFRLGLNVSTTRMILADGQAGEVVVAFGRFVARGDVVMGLVVFLVLTLVQLMVIGKGAERVAEVGARFTLDAMPGKQMSIDAALRNGALTEEEAETRRVDLGRESQFYGAMDGAMKFVKGDATVGLIVTALNLVAGLVIGMLRLNLSLAEAAQTFAILTIGDGLVSQIPSLLIALASGVLTTRVAAQTPDDDLGRTLQAELFANPKTLSLAGAFALAIGLVPGLPTVPFLIIAMALGGAAVVLHRRQRSVEGSPEAADTNFKEELDRRKKAAAAQAAVSDHLAPTVLPLVIEVGSALSDKMGFGQGRDGETRLLAELIPQARDHVAMTTGVKLPPTKVRAVPHLPDGQVVLRVNEVPVCTERVPVGRVLALAAPEELARLGVEGEATTNPLSGRPATWIDESLASAVEGTGVSVWTSDAAVSLHLVRVGMEHAESFIGLQEVAEMVKRLESVAPDLVKEVVGRVVSLGQIRDVLRQLVREGVNIRDLKTILEALGAHGDRSGDFIQLVDHVRRALGLQLAHGFAGPSRRVSAIIVDPVVEELVQDAVVENGQGAYLCMDPTHRSALLDTIRRVLQPMLRTGAPPVIVTHAPVRYFFQELIHGELPARVLAYEELPRDIHVMPVGRVRLEAVDAQLAA